MFGNEHSHAVALQGRRSHRTSRGRQAQGRAAPRDHREPVVPILPFDLLQRGAEDSRVRELQERLASIGYAPLTDPAGQFGDGTVVVVEAFQRSRGLPITGVIDETTWNRLIEAGWRLGERLLYLAHPHLRGDDVAELQVRLAQLGFNPGRIDGIFGSATEHALLDFQRNCGLETDGTLTRATLLEILRLTSIVSNRYLVTEARDQAGFDDVGAGPIVVCGQSPLAQLVAQNLVSAREVRLMEDATTDEVALFSNAHQAALVLSFQTLEQLNVIHLHYWASYHSHSRRAEQLAGAI
ncbi:MAG TPA: peptidoglycan-binding protein, partial [Acidimicrobiales bacterium]